MAQHTAIVGSGISKSLRSGLAAAAIGALLAMASPVRADEPAEPKAGQNTEPAASEPLPEVHESWARRASRELRRAPVVTRQGLAIVELPSEAAPGTRSRPRRALSVPSESPRLFLRSIGIEASECATRFRLPTKLKRDVESGTSVQVQAHLGLACSF
jgi:hypothetical protein